METYVNSAGRVITAEQAEQEYRKQLIATGRPLEGEEYDRGLQDWFGTYRKLTRKDHRSATAASISGGVLFALAALIAFVALISGAGLIAFVVILVAGGIMAFVLAALVVMFTSLKR